MACEHPLVRFMAVNFGWPGSNKGAQGSILKQTPGGSIARSSAISKHGKSATHKYAWAVFLTISGD